MSHHRSTHSRAVVDELAAGHVGDRAVVDVDGAAAARAEEATAFEHIVAQDHVEEAQRATRAAHVDAAAILARGARQRAVLRAAMLVAIYEVEVAERERRAAADDKVAG